MTMIKWQFSILAVALVLIGGLANQGHTADATAETILNGLQRNYDATTDFVADFEQETEVKTLNRSMKAAGQVTFKRPGKMYWRYHEPKGQFVLADGKSFYYYQPDQNQIIKSALKNAFRSDIPLSFLLGLGNLKKDFNATVKSSDESQHIVRLEPKTNSRGFSEVLLGLNKATYDIQWVSVRDAVGNLTTIRFSSMRKGTGVQESLFQLQIPNGADIIELGQ